jgi:hypothetical protein
LIDELFGNRQVGNKCKNKDQCRRYGHDDIEGNAACSFSQACFTQLLDEGMPNFEQGKAIESRQEGILASSYDGSPWSGSRETFIYG